MTRPFALSLVAASLTLAACGGPTAVIGTWTVSKWQWSTSYEPTSFQTPHEEKDVGTWTFTESTPVEGVYVYNFARDMLKKPDILGGTFVDAAEAATVEWTPGEGQAFTIVDEDPVFAGEWHIAARGLGSIQLHHERTHDVENSGTVAEASDVFLTMGESDLAAEQAVQSSEETEAPVFLDPNG